MGNQKLRGKNLSKIGFTTDKLRSLAIDIMSKHYKYLTKQEQLTLLSEVLQNPSQFVDEFALKPITDELIEKEVVKRKEIELREEARDFQVFGRKHIASNAFQQMESAMKLPVSEAGAMMPDAHMGYGLPIGGVLATRNSVIPYAVGLDIGCRMSLSIYDVSMDYFNKKNYQFKEALKSRTCFGTGGELSITQDHEVLERSEFRETAMLRQLHGKAAKQLGTSGSGNHFVEFGEVQLPASNSWGLAAGTYLGLLSHSGSRGLGASLAKHYTELAKSDCLLPRQVHHLAWLDLNTEAGQEYWLSMNLAGDYAKACHDQIHYHLANYLGLKSVVTIENHHNFAWKECHEGEELIVHRKGSTPAAKGELGIIPGSMATVGYIVKGKGEPRSLNSAAHGAGRKWSRSQARNSFTNSALKKLLSKERVTLIGGAVDEAPIAYKDLDEVMKSQTDLVEVVGSFMPRMVRMDKA